MTNWHPLRDPVAFTRARQALALQPAELAEAMHVTPRTIYRWEEGSRVIPGPAAVCLTLLALHPEKL